MNQTEENEKSIYKKNGRLIFKDLETLNSIIEENKSNILDYVNELESTMNFTSIVTVYDEMVTEIEEIENEEDFYELKAELEVNFMFPEDMAIECFSMPLNWQPFVNHKNTIQIGNWIYKFFKDKYIVITDGDESKISYASDLTTSKENENILVGSTHVSKLKTDWGTLSSCSYYHSDKRLIAELIALKIFIPSGTTTWVYGYNMYLQLKQQKKNWRKKWVSSKTKFTVRNLSYRWAGQSETTYWPTIESPNDKSSWAWTLAYSQSETSLWRPEFWEFESENHSRGTVGWCTINYAD